MLSTENPSGLGTPRSQHAQEPGGSIAPGAPETLFNPARTQEIAAEQLDVPFRTYRRHLKTAIEQITEVLWRWELGLED